MDDQKSRLQHLKTAFFERLSATQTLKDLDILKVEFFGRKGIIAELTETLKPLSLEEKRIAGPLINEFKKELNDAYETKEQELKTAQQKALDQRGTHFDVTSYIPQQLHGNLHPYTHVIREVEDVLISMGFTIAEGPEVETDYINFEALNIPSDHPARDMHDTFWLDVPGLLLRTHTSTVQIRSMLNKKPPLAVAAPGRCYRHEATDASHDFMFWQCEGLVIDKNISLAHLLGTLKVFLQTLFKKTTVQIRLRPSFFPFVEPGVEIDMTCPFCTEGCSVCKKSRWIEICGAGMVHPEVLKACSINPDEYSGFAFGFGLTRLVMLKYGIHDIRLLHNPKVEFLKQF